MQNKKEPFRLLILLIFPYKLKFVFFKLFPIIFSIALFTFRASAPEKKVT